MKIKVLLFTFPALFLIVFAASFVFESFRLHPRVNQLIISMSGDASFLNPVLAQDAASSNVNSFIFNGRIEYNENLDGFVGDLAESWKIIVGPESETR